MKINLGKVQHFLKYSASSFVSSLVENGVYLLLTYLLSRNLNGFALACVPLVVARTISGFINFNINRKLVFRSQRSTGAAMLRYFIQVIPIMALQMLLTFGIYTIFQIGAEQVILRGIIYAGVMLSLFVVNFILQQIWVFSYRDEKSKKRGGGI